MLLCTVSTVLYFSLIYSWKELILHKLKLKRCSTSTPFLLTPIPVHHWPTTVQSSKYSCRWQDSGLNFKSLRCTMWIKSRSTIPWSASSCAINQFLVSNCGPSIRFLLIQAGVEVSIFNFLKQQIWLNYVKTLEKLKDNNPHSFTCVV